MLKQSFKTGLGFGVTSGIITTLGLMVGLYSGTESALAVIGGILTIAIADSCSDSLGVHVSKEFENKSTTKEIWEATLVTFLSKFIIAVMFIIPLLIFSLKIAVIISIVLGLTVLTAFSYFIATERKVAHWKVILEHLFIGAFVVFITHYAGHFIREAFL